MLTHVHTHHTTPGHIPAHQNPHFEPLRANRGGGSGWVVSFIRLASGPLWGTGLPRPPVGGWGYVRSAALRAGLLLAPGVDFSCIYGVRESPR